MRIATVDRERVQRAWTDPQMLATPLFVLWLDEYVVGEDEDEQRRRLGWDPDTVRLEIEDDFRVTVPQPVLDKVYTAREIFTTDRFFRSLPDFIDFCNILSGTGTFDPTVFDPADAAECAWGITEALLLDPPADEGDEPVFADEIVGYVAAVVDAEGFVRPPDVLQLGNLEDRARTVEAAWSDDPTMFNAIWDKDAAKGADITRMVRDRLGLLARQLAGLPLTRGETRQVVEKLTRVMPRAVPNRPAAP